MKFYHNDGHLPNMMDVFIGNEKQKEQLNQVCYFDVTKEGLIRKFAFD
ncbi:hypothetical protein [Bacillus cereus]|nr:hypothetical protein [Bacillus cereus]